MKERLDKILMLVVYFYSVICIAGVYTCEYDLKYGIYDFINAFSFNEVVYPPIGDDLWCRAVYFDYLQFFILGILIAIRYLVFGKTYQK
jgi:hypothetical protein